MSSLPLRVTGFWCPRSFVVGVLSVDLGLHCCVYAPSRTVGRHLCVLWSRCSWCLRTVSSFFGCPLGVSWSIWFLGLDFCGEFCDEDSCGGILGLGVFMFGFLWADFRFWILVVRI